MYIYIYTYIYRERKKKLCIEVINAKFLLGISNSELRQYICYPYA